MRPIFLLVVAFAAIGLVFHFHPAIDLAVSGYFYDPVAKGFSPHWGWLSFIVKRSVYIFNDIWGALLVLGLVIGFLPARWIGTRLQVVRRARYQTLFLALALVIGPGLLVSLAKEYYPRPRPIETQAFDNTKPFMPVLTYSHVPGASSLSGHAATGFYLVALAYTDRRRRKGLYAAGLVAGVAIGATRIALGSHFLSDVLLSGVVTLLVVHLIAGLFRRVGGADILSAQEAS